MEIPCLGTTHADHFYGPVPCARALTQDEVEHEYEHNTGKVIVEAFAGLDQTQSLLCWFLSTARLPGERIPWTR